MSDRDTLQTVKAVLSGVRDEGLDPEGVRILLEMIDGKRKTSVRTVPAGARQITRAECVEPGCQWENSTMCRFTGEHRFEERTYALVETPDE